MPAMKYLPMAHRHRVARARRRTRFEALLLAGLLELAAWWTVAL